MSPTTLYREGTDLDALLAELDSQYPDRVRVVEVSHPRDGGFMGFFAKQRVGVHYRLFDPQSGSGDVGGPGDTGLEPPHPLVTPGLTPLGESTGPNGPGITFDPHDDDRAPGASHLAAQDDSGTQFAQILAELALRKAGQTAGIPGGRPGPGTTSGATVGVKSGTIRLGPSPEALLSARTGTGARSGATARVAAGAEPGAGVRTSAAVRESSAARTAVAAPAGSTPHPAPTDRQTPPRAVARFQPAASHAYLAVPANSPAGTTKAIKPAFDSLPEVSADGVPAETAANDTLAEPAARRQPDEQDAAHAEQAAAREAQHPSGSLADESVTARQQQVGRRGAGLHWPLAATDYSSGIDPAVTRQRLAEAEHAGREAALLGASYVEQSESVVSARLSEPGCGAANFALRRQLVELGVPVDRVPGNAAHAYGAIEELVGALPPVPAPPTEAGQIMVLAGPARDAVTAAETLLTDATSPWGVVYSYGCATGLGQRALVSKEHVIGSVTHARDVAAELRASQAEPALVIIATDGPTWTDRPAELIDAIAPDSLWAVVDATWKPGDATRVLRSLGPVDGIAVSNASRSGSPATVWGIDTPIALLDGRPSSASAWAVLLLGKLSELEQECSDVQS